MTLYTVYNYMLSVFPYALVHTVYCNHSVPIGVSMQSTFLVPMLVQLVESDTHA